MCYGEISIVLCLTLYYKVFSFFCEQTLVQFILFTCCYYTISELAIQFDLLNCIVWRNSCIARWLNRKYANIEFDHESCEPVLKDLDREENKNRLKIFAVEPHGVSSFALSFLFAGNSSSTIKNSDSLKNNRVIAHWSLKLIPIIREFFAFSGVIGSSRFTVKRHLETHKQVSLALSTSGMEGKVICAKAPNSENYTLQNADNTEISNNVLNSQPKTEYKIVLPVFKRKRKGFIKMAIDNSALLVPTLSLHEQFAYKRIEWLPSTATFGFTSHPFPCWIYGYYGMPMAHTIPNEFSKDNKMRVVMAEPIDCSKYTNVNQLSKHYFTELEKLAETHNATLKYYTSV